MIQTREGAVFAVAARAFRRLAQSSNFIALFIWLYSGEIQKKITRHACIFTIVTCTAALSRHFNQLFVSPIFSIPD